jgi:FeS assembly SUF system protein
MTIVDWLKRPATAGRREKLETDVVAALRTVFDPEIPVNIYDLGLIYNLDVAGDGNVAIRMTLTAPGCPVAQTFPGTVADAVRSVDGIKDVEVELVWEPPWSREMMSEAARLQLGIL